MGKLGQYKIKLGSDTLEKAIQTAEFEGRLDSVSEFRVTLALPFTEQRKLKTTDLPSTADYDWQGKRVFSGILSEVEETGRGQLVVTYQDALSAAHKHVQNLFFKEGPLSGVLRQILEPLGLSASFQGDFATKVSGLRVAGQDTLEVLKELSDRFGFFFYLRSKTVAFLRVGRHIDSYPIEEKNIFELMGSESNTETLDRVVIKYFDSRTMEPQEKRIGQSDLYDPIEGLSRRRWEGPKKLLSTTADNALQFEQAPQTLPYRISKRRLGQDCCRIRSHQYLGLPGDEISLSGHREGNYLLAGLQIKVGSSLPIAEAEILRG